jgi:hypothetical protein
LGSIDRWSTLNVWPQLPKGLSRAQRGGIQALDEAFIASRTTTGAYRYTYDRYVQSFRERRDKELAEPDLYVGSAFVYSWMSTIKQPDSSLATVNAAVTVLNNAHTLQPTDLGVTGNDPATIDADSVSQLVILIEPVRHFLGSVIGTSKMLHFVNPEVFPTWYIVIHCCCRGPEQISANDGLKIYVEYTFCVHRLINHPDLRPESTHRCCKPWTKPTA